LGMAAQDWMVFVPPCKLELPRFADTCAMLHFCFHTKRGGGWRHGTRFGIPFRRALMACIHASTPASCYLLPSACVATSSLAPHTHTTTPHTLHLLHTHCSTPHTLPPPSHFQQQRRHYRWRLSRRTPCPQNFVSFKQGGDLANAFAGAQTTKPTYATRCH